jgi:uncharacterized membrane protein YfcA
MLETIFAEENHIWLMPMMTFIISFFTSMGGVSGAFLLLPIQMSLFGFVSPSVSATNQLYNIVAIPGGVLKFIRDGRMLWKLTWIVVLGTMPGVFLGAFIRVEFLPEPDSFKVFAGFVLLYLAVRMIQGLLQNKASKKPKEGQDFAKVRVFNFKKLEYEFMGEIYSVPVIPVFLISLAIGIIGGVYGIGGGAMMAPILVSIFGLPVYTIAASMLMGTFMTSVVAVIFFQILSSCYPSMEVAPDFMTGFLFGLGGLAGIFLGAKFQHYFSEKFIKIVLILCLSFVAIRYILILFR